MKALFARQYINGSTVMVRRECFDRVGPFDEQLRYSQDMEMWFRLLQHFEFGRVPVRLPVGACTPEQGSRESRSHQKEAQQVLERLFIDLSGKGLLDIREKTAGDPEDLARRHIWFGRSVSRGRGWYDMGEKHLRRALSIWPSPGNPARLHLLLNRLTPLHHRWQRLRVRIRPLVMCKGSAWGREKHENIDHPFLVPVVRHSAAGNFFQGAGRRHRPGCGPIGKIAVAVWGQRRYTLSLRHPLQDRGGAG